MTTTEIKATDLILNEEGEELEIVSIKGRWVKLSDDSNVSRATAAEWRQAYLDERPEEEEADEGEEAEGKMSETLRKYRTLYVPNTSCNGNASVDNGDEVAEILRGRTPDEICAIADHLFGELPGTHWEKYQHLNLGSRRMNAGNRIRALIRRGDKTIADLEAAIKGDDLVDDETAV